MRLFQAVISCLLLLITLLLLVVVFPASPLIIAGWAICFAGWLFLAFRKSLKGKIFWLSASGIILVNIFLTNHVYTTLLQYQAGSQLGRFIRIHAIKGNEVAQ